MSSFDQAFMLPMGRDYGSDNKTNNTVQELEDKINYLEGSSKCSGK